MFSLHNEYKSLHNDEGKAYYMTEGKQNIKTYYNMNIKAYYMTEGKRGKTFFSLHNEYNIISEYDYHNI